jgi:hypothetical protein
MTDSPRTPTQESRLGQRDGAEPVTSEDVRWLLRSLGLRSHLPLLSMSQVSPLLIIQMFRALFTIQVQDLREHRTRADEVHNMRILLSELSEAGIDLDNVSAEAIVDHNEEHLSRLLSVFIDVHHVQLGADHGNSTPHNEAASVTSSPIDKMEFLHDYFRDVNRALQGGRAGSIPAEDDAGAQHAHGGHSHARQYSRDSRVDPQLAGSGGFAAAGAATGTGGPDQHRGGTADVEDAAERQQAPDLASRLTTAQVNVAGARCRKCSSHNTTRAALPTFGGLSAAQADRIRAAMARNRRTDERIELLRSQRFVESMRDLRLGQRMGDWSRLQAERRQELAAEFSRQRAGNAEMRRMTKEEDLRLREHHENNMCSLANYVSGRMELLKPGSVRRYVERESADADHAVVANQRSYMRCVTAWRRMNPLAMRGPAVAHTRGQTVLSARPQRRPASTDARGSTRRAG